MAALPTADVNAAFRFLAEHDVLHRNPFEKTVEAVCVKHRDGGLLVFAAVLCDMQPSAYLELSGLDPRHDLGPAVQSAATRRLIGLNEAHR
jgi:hypothetical protein